MNWGGFEIKRYCAATRRFDQCTCWCSRKALESVSLLYGVYMYIGRSRVSLCRNSAFYDWECISLHQRLMVTSNVTMATETSSLIPRKKTKEKKTHMTVIIIVLITHCFIRHGVSYVKNSAARDLCPTLKVYFHKNLAMHRHNYNCFPELGYIKFTTIVVTGAWQTKHSSLMVRARSFIRWIFLQHWLVRCLKWNQPLSRTHTSLGPVLNIALLLCQNQIVWFRQKCGIVKYRGRSIISFPGSIPVCPEAICLHT